MNFIAFLLVIAGSVNWLLIGLLQYDFVAGIFGYQGSVFPRLIYIVVGAAALFLVVKLFIDKGSIHVWGAKKKKLKEAREQYTRYEPRHANVEASREESRRRESGYNEHARYDDYDYDRETRGYHAESDRHDNRRRSLFDEHIGED